MRKYILSSIIILFFCLIGTGIVDYGRVQAMEQPEYLSLEVINAADKPLIQLREISQIYDWQLVYQAESKTVIINNGEQRVDIKIGNTEYNNQELVAVPQIKEGRTYISPDLFKYLLNDLEEEKIPALIAGLKLKSEIAAPGDIVKAEISLINLGTEAVNLNYASGQLYDLFLLDDQQEIWRWSEDKMFTMALVSKDLEAGDHLYYKEEIPLMADLNAGEYIVSGKIATREPLQLPERIIKITE